MKKLLSVVAVMAVVTSCFADTFLAGKKAWDHHNYIQAAEEFSKACDDGNGDGCFYLGTMYEKGDGIAQNKYKASALYASACRYGIQQGCSHMGLTFDTP